MKKLLLLCSSLELGRDGVGDYSRQLGAAFARLGIDSRIIALNDQHLSACTVVEQEQIVGSLSIRGLRLPSSMGWNKRIDIARRWKAKFDPDVLSLQFVPYGYQRKGLPIGLAGRLKKIGGSTPWNLMFHELWIGMSATSSMKERTIGLMQRRLVHRMIRSLRPKSICTQSQLYRQYLEQLGYETHHIKLFGNIARSDTRDRHFTRMGDGVRFLVFGSIHPSSNIEFFATECRTWSTQTGRSIEFVFVGRNGSEIASWLSVLQRSHLEFSVLGEQPESEVSRQLSLADWGIVTTPIALIEKSGSAAAMLEHELPVLSVSQCWKPRGITFGFSMNGVIEYKPGQLDCLLTNQHKFDFEYTSPLHSARAYIEHIQSKSTKVV